MKNIKKLFLVLTMSTFVILLSCNEESTNTPTTTDYSSYYPMTVGSWWVNESWRTDENFVADSLLSRDSTVIVSEEMKGGKNAKVIITFDTFTGETIDTSYEYFENNSVYEWEQSSPFSEEEGWIERGSFTKTKITIIDTNVTDANFADAFIFSGNLKMEITKGINKTVSLKNTDYTAMTSDQMMTMEGTMTIPGIGSVPLTMEMSGTMFLVKNIGKAQMLTTMSTSAMGMSEMEYNKQILVDWSIK